MPGKDGGEVHCPRTLGAIEAPDRFGPSLVHVHGFRTITPAGSHSDTQSDSFALKFLFTGSRFPHSTNSGIGNHALNRGTIGLSKLGGIERGQPIGHLHGLSF